MTSPAAALARWGAALRRHLLLIDAVVAVLLTAGALLALSSLRYSAPAAAAAAACSACTAAVAVRRLVPLAAALLALTGLLVYQRLSNDAQGAVAPLAVVLTVYMLARNGSGRRHLVQAGAVLGYALAVCVLIGRDTAASSISDVALAWLGFAALPAIAGAMVARRAALSAELAAVAERLKAEQALRAARAGDDERTRVARELHDVVAHSMSVMVIQAGAARLVAAVDSAAARTALQTVVTSGREAMADIRRIMGVLRRGDDEVADAPAGLGQVSTLIDRMVGGGWPTELRIDGGRTALPADVDMVAFRIVQEALTNVVKHAGPARVTVHVRVAPDTVELEIVDSGRGLPAHRRDGLESGHGLLGMRERVAVFGGEFHAGNTVDGGYRVHARIPLLGGDASTQMHPATAATPARVSVPAHTFWQRWSETAFAAAWLLALEIEAWWSPYRHGSLALNATVVAVMALLVPWRRRAPLLFLAAVGALAAPLSDGLTSLDRATVAGAFVLGVPVYTLAAWETRTRAGIGLFAWIAGAAATGLARHAQVGDIAGAGLMACAVFAAGRVMQRQRRIAAELHDASAVLAAEREDRARLAVVAERMRIARELHALVANGVIAMVVQAEAAQRLLDADPRGATEAVDVIEATGRASLTQLRHILGVLRAGPESWGLQPQPGLDQIHVLVQRCRDAGQPVDLSIAGEPGPVFAGVDLVAYRIVEEALAAADRRARHPVAIALRFDDEHLELDLDLSAAGVAGHTWPTAALRHRVALCDGDIRHAGDRESRLVVRLPRKLQEALR